MEETPNDSGEKGTPITAGGEGAAAASATAGPVTDEAEVTAYASDTGTPITTGPPEETAVAASLEGTPITAGGDGAPSGG